jgi:acetyl esterase/lipase
MKQSLRVRCGTAAVLLLSCGSGAATPLASSPGGAAGQSQAAAGAPAGGAGASGLAGAGVPTSAGGSAGGGSAGQSQEVGGSAGQGQAGMSPAGSAGQAAVCAFGTSEAFLWSGAAPGATAATLVEKFTDRSSDPAVKDRSVTGVSKPSLFPFLAKQPNGAAAIIVPGGGYTHLAWDKEGIDIAAWLNSLGVSAFVLKYRMPADFPGSPWIPLADAQRALRTVRQNASACGIDAARIGVIGFSAGGHSASQLETRSGAQTSPATDTTDAVDARPSFGVLLYPVISMDAAIAHSGSKVALLGVSPTAAAVTLYSSELQVTATTPPTFLGVSSKDTTVKPENSVSFDDALKANGVAQELHVYQDGTHGVGIRDASGDMALWPTQCAAWLTTQNVLPAPK